MKNNGTNKHWCFKSVGRNPYICLFSKEKAEESGLPCIGKHKNKSGKIRDVVAVGIGWYEAYDNTRWVYYINGNGAHGDCSNRAFKAWLKK